MLLQTQNSLVFICGLCNQNLHEAIFDNIFNNSSFHEQYYLSFSVDDDVSYGWSNAIVSHTGEVFWAPPATAR